MHVLGVVDTLARPAIPAPVILTIASARPMRTTKTVHVVSCHAEGEVGDVIVGVARTARIRFF